MFERCNPRPLTSKITFKNRDYNPKTLLCQTLTRYFEFPEMYSLLSGFLKYARRKEEYAVLLLGLDNAGKTVRGEGERVEGRELKGES